MKKIFLIGLPGSGKTTLGRQLADHLGLPFVDLDKEVEKHEGKLISEIFQQQGENHFRLAERSVLRNACELPTGFVMATGGGAPCFFDNMHVMNAAGVTLFLDVPARIIRERLERGNLNKRPLFAGLTPDALKDKIEFLRTHRLPFYRLARVSVTDAQVTAAQLANLV
ncbi:MAG: shikimate kinase [Cyclobacteriaceae bacterium]|jgi:shikimate kinase|nr:shikimate kinase [Flammeovirgaceae bacterium]